MSARNTRVSAIVVSYNVADLLRRCLESLQQTEELHEVIVVDSSSADDSAAVVERDFHDVVLRVVPNRGFGAGVNAGMEIATGDALLILNPDTTVPRGSVAALFDALYSKENIGVVGPRLVYPDGSTQSSRRRFPTAWTPLFESTILEEWMPGNRWVRRYRMCDAKRDGFGQIEFVDWVVGAALMVKREAVEQAGGFCEAFFLYGEELEWCYRIRRHGWQIGYVPNAEVRHHEAASTSQDRLASRIEFDRGRVRAQRTLHGTMVARRTARFLKLNYAVMLLRESVKWTLGHRRELRRWRMSRYWKLLRSDLND